MPLSSARLAHPLLAELPDDTLRRLEIYAALVRKWQRAINLIGASTLDDLWVRHFADSLQISDAVPEARRWLDLGSGAGFPGLVTAIKYASDENASVHLIEADRRKCVFLETVARETGAKAIIHCGRIEEAVPALSERIDAVSARAVAPLAVLIDYAAKFIDKGAVAVFHKGKLFQSELTATLTAGKYLISTIDSKTCADGRLILVRAAGSKVHT